MVCGMMGVERTVAGMEFREKLRKLRLERGLSQQELADGIFVSQSAEAKWENGLGLPSEASREALAAFFDVPAAALLTKEDCGAIADFLESHSYRNDPELTEADTALILDRVEAVLAEYHAGG